MMPVWMACFMSALIIILELSNILMCWLCSFGFFPH